MKMKKKIKILIAEDEAIIAMRMEMELKSLGYDVCKPVSTGKKVIKSAENDKPDIVLMDLHLVGKMPGIEAARTIWNNYKIPMIFMTGYQDEELMQKAMELNPVAYLIKPVEICEIEAAIDLAKEKLRIEN
ncbi:Two component system response regulator [Desulfonema magnum]|uniref:Two component system response regulator n=2 Tax=Desulfonema magnum TaxID=45655 RepID=A0A975BFA9_9BACT|nr:Two component system response regulator [Desulfonema magnum]